jgi:hypothetical protein
MIILAALASSTLAVCSAQSGHAFYATGAAVKSRDDLGGWTKDQTTGGRTTLSLDDRGEFDIMYADATGGVFSSRAEGAVVMLARKTDNDAAFVLAYPGGKTLEVYQFNRDGSGTERMMLAQSKSTDLMAKVGAYVADCTFTGLFK